MANETERKFLIIDDRWKTLPHLDVLEIEQGYIPQDNKNGTRLYITFPDDEDIVAQITIETDEQTFNFDGIKEDKPGEFEKMRQLSAYNNDTSEVTLTGTVEARVRIQKSQTEEDKMIFAIKDYIGSGRSKREEFEVYIHLDDARHVLNSYAENVLSKERTVIPYAHNKWEVDRYLDKNEGLVTVDVEVQNADNFNDLKKLPSAGPDITDVEELRNQNIAAHGVPTAFKNQI